MPVETLGGFFRLRIAEYSILQLPQGITMTDTVALECELDHTLSNVAEF
jgi:hypothetical protein